MRPIEIPTIKVSSEQEKENKAFFKATEKLRYDECGHVYLDEGNLLYIFGKGVEYGKRMQREKELKRKMRSQ